MKTENQQKQKRARPDLKAEEMAMLHRIAAPAWPKPQYLPPDHPTPADLVQCLANVACNRLDRIRELEKIIYKFCDLGKSC